MRKMKNLLAILMVLAVVGCGETADKPTAKPEPIEAKLIARANYASVYVFEYEDRTVFVASQTHGVSIVVEPKSEFAESDEQIWPADAVRVFDRDNSFTNWAEAQLATGAHPLPAYAEVRDGKIFNKESGQQLQFSWCATQLGAVVRGGDEESGYRSSYMVPKDVHDRWFPVKDEYTVAAMIKKGKL